MPDAPSSRSRRAFPLRLVRPIRDWLAPAIYLYTNGVHFASERIHSAEICYGAVRSAIARGRTRSRLFLEFLTENLYTKCAVWRRFRRHSISTAYLRDGRKSECHHPRNRPSLPSPRPAVCRQFQGNCQKIRAPRTVTRVDRQVRSRRIAGPGGRRKTVGIFFAHILRVRLLNTFWLRRGLGSPG
jgi:hypothetical protein